MEKIVLLAEALKFYNLISKSCSLLEENPFSLITQYGDEILVHSPSSRELTETLSMQ